MLWIGKKTSADPARRVVRRQGTGSLAGVVLMALSLVGAAAATAGDLRILAPSAPGSGWDLLAQALKQELGDERGDDLVEVVNVPGGNGAAGLAQFAGNLSGSVLLMSGLTMLDAALLGRSPVEIGRLTPIARLTSDPFVIALPAASPLKDIADVRTALIDDPGKIVWGGGPAGGIEHVATILFAQALEIDAARLSYVPFLSSQDAAGAASEGRVSAVIMTASDAAAEIKARRLRPIAISSRTRVDLIPAPTLVESGIPLDFTNWRGIMARADISPGERASLVARVNRVAASPGWRDLLAQRGWQDTFLAGETFGAFFRDQQRIVADALKTAGLPKKAQP